VDKVAQRLVVGFIRHDNRLVVDVDHCPIAEAALTSNPSGPRPTPPKGGIKVTSACPEDWDSPDSFSRTTSTCSPPSVNRRDRIRAAGRMLIDASAAQLFALECASR
jgi:hypothetical protein